MFCLFSFCLLKNINSACLEIYQLFVETSERGNV
jgi:hypothetical protein